MSDEKIISDELGIPSPSSLSARLVVGAINTLSGLGNFVSSLMNNHEPNTSCPDDQTHLISSEKGEKVWKRKGCDHYSDSIDKEETLIKMFLTSVSKHGELPFFGNRTIIENQETTDDFGKIIKKRRLGDYFWISYSDALRQVEMVAGYIKRIGINENEKIAIFADTHSEWFTMFLAILRVKCTAVTVYSTLSDDAILYALNLCEVSAILVDEKSIKRLVTFISAIKSLEHVFCTTACSSSVLENVKDHFTFFEETKIESYKFFSNIKPGIINFSEYSAKSQQIRDSVINESPKIEDMLQAMRNFSGQCIFGLDDSEPTRYSSMPVFTTEVKFDKEITFAQSSKDSDHLPMVHFIISILKKEEILNLPDISEYSADDQILIMFTSGSTGIPKGVTVTNRNLISAIHGGTHEEKAWRNVIYAAYLPLAHIFELLCELAVCYSGGCIGYSCPLTLFDTSPMIMSGGKGDLPSLGPTLSPFVPLVLERLKKIIISKFKEKGEVALSLLASTLDSKRTCLEKGILSTCEDKLIFNKIQELVGSRLKFSICGGAPLLQVTEEFANLVFGASIKQGYGLTETCGAGTLGSFYDMSRGNTGPPFPGIKVKLVSWEEAGYLPEDEPNPRGEIHLSGAMVSLGYYKQPELTESAFYIDSDTKERWFRTGDIAEFLPNGTFKIIDRKKDIVKLKDGEYVSLIAVEQAAAKSLYVENLCALPNNDSECLILIVSPSVDAVCKLALKKDIKIQENLDIIKNKEISEEITKSILQICRGGKLAKHEIPRKVIVVSETWLPCDGLVTPTMKIKRFAIAKFYSHLL